MSQNELKKFNFCQFLCELVCVCAEGGESSINSLIACNLIGWEHKLGRGDNKLPSVNVWEVPIARNSLFVDCSAVFEISLPKSIYLILLAHLWVVSDSWGSTKMTIFLVQSNRIFQNLKNFNNKLLIIAFAFHMMWCSLAQQNTSTV